MLYSVKYLDMTDPLEFRRHNSRTNNRNRYAIKPYYKSGSTNKLPYCPVIYLGLSRLVPFGEFQNDDAVENIKKNLPTSYLQEIKRLYEEFTGLKITITSPQRMGDVKIRSEFTSDIEGVDSNTISAGEDNLFIILTAIVSLKYYFESIETKNAIESILLIDELDATLHPSIQIKLLKLFLEYHQKYKIQIFFTTHSLSLLEEALVKKLNVIYLIDNITSVKIMEDVDIYKIKMHLHSITRNDIYLNKAIPVFTEDDEARLFLRIILDHFSELYKDDFVKVRSLFHLVDANIGATNLISIFNDIKLFRSTMRAICILDGDQRSERKISNCILALPGEDSPENLIMKYVLDLFDNDDPFWLDETILHLGYGKVYFRDHIRPEILDIEGEISQLRSEKKSTKGIRREKSKKVFNNHKQFFELLFIHWVNNEDHREQLEQFYKDLYTAFKKVAEFHGINANDWRKND